MDWLNPVEWAAWIYGKLFQQHVIVGGFLMTGVCAAIGLMVWIRGVDKYKEEHPISQATQSEETTAPKQQTVTASNSASQGVTVQQGASSQGMQSATPRQHQLTVKDMTAKGMAAAVWGDRVDIKIKGGHFSNNGAVVQNQGPKARIDLQDVTANGNKAVVQNGPAPVPPASPPITLNNSPGSAVSVNQQGGITAGQITVDAAEHLSLSDVGVTNVGKVQRGSCPSQVVDVLLNNANDETGAFGDQLKIALIYTGMTVNMGPTLAFGANGHPIPRGVVIDAGDNCLDMANNISTALAQVHAASPARLKVNHVTAADWKDRLSIIVSPPN